MLDHLRTHEKDRWTLIHINSYTYILLIREQSTLHISLFPFPRCIFSILLYPLFISRYTFCSPVQRFRYFRDGWPVVNIHASVHVIRVYFTWCTGDASSRRCFRLVVVPLVTEEKREGRESTKRETTSYEFRFNIFFLIFFLLFFFTINCYAYFIS